ncbi:MAG TPA: beta-ketoacyl-[acyl-carrier-protein] synthase family protein [Chloroflexota bacterium]|jgi:3-oxoacyl-[acyl-carrier-protein] synthase II|nr:beta-ketoacyl-[acyl-carrier-protein] synthase family protein [Chloroflexota bacterium]
MRRRVVVTGIGAVTPVGIGRDGLWDGLRRGASAVRPITRFDPAPFRSQVAAEIGHFDPLDYLEARRARRLDRFAQLALASARQAFDDAGLAPGRFCPERVGVYLGSALGGVAFAEAQHVRFLRDGIRAVEPSLALAVFGGAGATNVALQLDLRGPVIGNANSCASGAIALGEAFRLIRAGGADAVLAGGVEAPLAPLSFGAFDLIRAMSDRNATPSTASRPFDRGRDGFVMGEGAAMLVLEELGHAQRREAPIYAEVVGYGTTNDAFHMVQPRPDGAEAARAMALALADAGLPAGEVGYLNAHATSTPLGDAAEARAIQRVFGEAAARLPVSGTKGLYGHPLGASGAIEAAITALALQRAWLPPTCNLAESDCQLALIRGDGLERRVEVAMNNAFGFGGINASVVLRRWSGV